MAATQYDVIVVGGGIFGVAIAWDAASRGLRVALLDKGDFGHATSANHFKMVHGGIRYLQHGDLVRIRESVRERRALLRIAPHLVEPLPILIPTYGHGMTGKAAIGTGMRLYDILAADRNAGIPDRARWIPRSRLLSKDECLEYVPDVERSGLTGGALFSDAQVYNPPRLALAFVRSAVSAGAHAANYVEAKQFLFQDRRVVGVAAEDVLTGDRFDIRGGVVINATGPWAESLLGLGELSLASRSTFSRDSCFVVGRPILRGDTALAVMGRTKDPDALLSRPARHLFLVPWREYTLVGVWHTVHEGNPEEFSVSRRELQGFLDEINGAYPAAELTLDDISLTNAGLTLFGVNEPGAVNLSYGKRSRLIDHKTEHGVAGLITVVGVRATVARGVAEEAVNLAFQQLRRDPPPCRTAVLPLHGAEFGNFSNFRDSTLAGRPPQVGDATWRDLIRNYGSEYRSVLSHTDSEASLVETLPGSINLKVEVVHSVHREMALTLSDVVFRRTGLGTGGHPGNSAIHACARLMAAELGWSAARVECELEQVGARFRHGPGPGQGTGQATKAAPA